VQLTITTSNKENLIEIDHDFTKPISSVIAAIWEIEPLKGYIL
jgi:hypothetical protein